MLHEIKIDEPYADAILDGRKTFVVRYNNKGYNAGDKVKFQVYNGYAPAPHRLNGCVYNITYVYSGAGVENRHVVFGIKA